MWLLHEFKLRVRGISKQVMSSNHTICFSREMSMPDSWHWNSRLNLELKGHAVKVNSQLLVLCRLKSVHVVKIICFVPEAKFTAILKKDIEKWLLPLESIYFLSMSSILMPQDDLEISLSRSFPCPQYGTLNIFFSSFALAVVLQPWHTNSRNEPSPIERNQVS